MYSSLRRYVRWLICLPLHLCDKGLDRHTSLSQAVFQLMILQLTCSLLTFDMLLIWNPILRMHQVHHAFVHVCEGHQDQLMCVWCTPPSMSLIVFCLQGMVFDYYVDDASCSMVPWENKVPSFSYMPDNFSSLFVPTVDTTRLTYFLDTLIAKKHYVMFVGNTGTLCCADQHSNTFQRL